MTCKRQFSCDLCHSSLSDASEGIGIRWAALDNIKAVYLHDSEHHLCNKCCTGLRAMFADLDRINKIHADLALEVERERA
jgi:hypothetical protein